MCNFTICTHTDLCKDREVAICNHQTNFRFDTTAPLCNMIRDAQVTFTTQISLIKTCVVKQFIYLYFMIHDVKKKVVSSYKI